jgi:hypothetical protein
MSYRCPISSLRAGAVVCLVLRCTGSWPPRTERQLWTADFHGLGQRLAIGTLPSAGALGARTRRAGRARWEISRAGPRARAGRDGPRAGRPSAAQPPPRSASLARRRPITALSRARLGAREPGPSDLSASATFVDLAARGHRRAAPLLGLHSKWLPFMLAKLGLRIGSHALMSTMASRRRSAWRPDPGASAQRVYSGSAFTR